MSYPVAFIEYFKQLPMTLTSLRKAVLFALWSAQKPLKAYDILEYLLSIKPNMTATTVYRALDFFMEAGLLHKIESIQAYTLCIAPDKHHPSEILMVCNTCHQVIEVYDANMRELLNQLANNSSFELSQDAIELKGLCSRCH
jgi:Fur family zinc uptake transcriptional regulator